MSKKNVLLAASVAGLLAVSSGIGFSGAAFAGDEAVKAGSNGCGGKNSCGGKNECGSKTTMTEREHKEAARTAMLAAKAAKKSAKTAKVKKKV